MKPSEIYLLAAKCLVLDDSPETIETLRNKFKTSTRWLDDFIYLCSNNYVLPAIYYQLKKYGITDLFPTEYNKHLERIYRLNKKRNFEILDQIKEINEALGKDAITPVYLKGTAQLMDGLYEDPGIRMIGDIDFLVNDNDYLKTAAIIQKLGYKTDSQFYDDVRFLKDYPRMYKEDVPADIEIHRVPVNLRYSSELSTNDILESKKQAVKNSSWVPSDSNKLKHNFIHCQLSNKGAQTYIIPLRDIYDAWLLLKKQKRRQLPETIKHKKAATVYIDFALHLFSPEPAQTKTGKKFIKRYFWLKNHYPIHHFYLVGLKLYRLIFIRYIVRIIDSVFRKSSRNYIFNRLKDPKWYRSHINGIRKVFK